MFNKQCLKLGSTALLLFAALIISGCGTITTLYRATPEDTRDLSPVQANKLLIKAAQTDHRCINRETVIRKTVSVTSEKIEVTCKLAGRSYRRSFRFAESPTLVAMLDVGSAFSGRTYDNTCINASETGGRGIGSCMFFWNHTRDYFNARDLVRAWYVLARAATAFSLAQEDAFERAAQSYRSAQVKPQLPEEAVRYKVQAELAVQQKRFDDAVDLYDQALGIAPWWPPGHYNRGLILGELEDFQEGIRALQKYLKLEPDAPNARAVQLRIYQWESLVPRTAK